MRAAALVVLVLAGCRDPRPAHDGATPAHSEAPDDAAVPAPVRLPRSPASPVRRLCQPTPATIARLAAIEHADFAREDRGSDGETLRVRHTTRARPVLGVTLELGACKAACPGLDDRPALPERLRGRPDTRLDRGALDDARLALPIQTQYALGANDEGGRRTYVDAYTLYADDGAAWLRVTASYLDDAVGGVDDRGLAPAGSAADRRRGVVDRLLAIAPPEDLQKLATAFLSFYLHECQ